MLINVPQYIEVEDKVAGPLTVKQLGWMIALGVVLLIMWNVFSGVAFFILGFPVTLLFLALTFYRPYGQPLGSFIIFGFLYYFRPKIYTWKRSPEREQTVPRVAQIAKSQNLDKQMTSETLHGLAQLLDSEGMNHNENIDEILKKHNVKR